MIGNQCLCCEQELRSYAWSIAIGGLYRSELHVIDTMSVIINDDHVSGYFLEHEEACAGMPEELTKGSGSWDCKTQYLNIRIMFQNRNETKILLTRIIIKLIENKGAIVKRSFVGNLWFLPTVLDANGNPF